MYYQRVTSVENGEMADGFATRRTFLRLLQLGTRNLLSATADSDVIVSRKTLGTLSARDFCSSSTSPGRPPKSRSSIAHTSPARPLKEVETVFSDIVKSLVPDAFSRKALIELKRALSSARNCAEFESALVGNSGLLFKRQPWLFFLDLLRYSSKPVHAIQVFEWKLRQPFTVFTSQEYALIIRVAGKLGMLEKAKALYEGMPTRGVRRTVDVENAHMYAHAYDAGKNDCGEALKVFEQLRKSTNDNAKPNLTSYNTALSCYSKLRHLQHLEKTFEELVTVGFSPTVETYNCLMLAYRRLGIWWRMEETFCLMQAMRLKPNGLTFRTLIRGYADASLLDRMEKTHEVMLKHRYPLRAATAEAVIAAFKKAGEFGKMEKILFSIKARGFQRNMSKLLVSSHAQKEEMECMEDMVDQLMRNGDVAFSPELAVTVIKAYFKRGEHERMQNFVEVADCCAWNLNRSFYNTLIYLYAKHGLYGAMEWYFERMLASKCRPNFRSFQIMFRAYQKGNMPAAAQEVLSEMKAMMHLHD